MAGEFSLSC